MDGRKPQRAETTPLTRFLTAALLFCGVLLVSSGVQAMGIDQMRRLPGTELLDQRTDKLLEDCGLPALIRDTATDSTRQPLRWHDAVMRLSAGDWELEYSRQRRLITRGSEWNNPAQAGTTCLTGLSTLVIETRGNSGILSVRKRTDNQGYITSYHIPENLYTAHQIIGLTGHWTRNLTASGIRERFGTPDEILTGSGGHRVYRYWVVERQNTMPVSVHAVDFEVAEQANTCSSYTVHTPGTAFVRERFDALQHQWERSYVLD